MSSSSSQTVDPLSLLGTGIILGMVHVLTGPDHLSALATLSANVPCTQAFFLGIRWGVGHSTGLVLVAVVFLIMAMRNDSDTVDVPDRLMQMFETLVGLIMVALGIYGIQRALQKRATTVEAVNGDGLLQKQQQQQHQQQHHQDATTSSSLLKQQQVYSTRVLESSTLPTSSYQGGRQSPNPNNRELQNTELLPTTTMTTTTTRRHFEDLEMEDWNEGDDDRNNSNKNYNHQGWGGSCCYVYHRVIKRLSAKTFAVLVGIVHGFAGPGGVLGVIPAVQLKNPKLSALYLSSFCVSSTLTMGCYATLYGMCTSRLASSSSSSTTTSQRDFVIECFSAALSIVVGIVWLVLLAFGKLEDVFP